MRLERSRPTVIVATVGVVAVVALLAVALGVGRGPGGSPSPSASPSVGFVESPSAFGVPSTPTPVAPPPTPEPPPASDSGVAPPPPPPDEGTPEPCGTYDVRCNKLPVDGAGAVITPDLPCGELGTCRLSMGIAHPRGAGGPWPVVVVEPGGPRPPGADQYLGDFAGLVASQGAVVFVADYREGPRWGGGDPGTYQDIGCAIKFARENAAQYGGDPSRVTLVAHSLGPFFASIVALSPNAFEPPPGTCLAANGSPQPDAFVGIAGVYSTQDVSAQYLDGFFGGTQSAAPEAWNAGDPYAVVAAKSRLDVPVRLVHGAIDNNVIPASSERFEQALEAAGYDSKLVVVPNSDHSGILQDYRTIQAVMDVAALPKR